MITTNLSLDGVVQDPDGHGGFKLGGRFDQFGGKDPEAWAKLETDDLLRRINTCLVRWARRKFKRLRSFKKAKRWWHWLLRRQPQLFSHWAWMIEF